MTITGWLRRVLRRREREPMRTPNWSAVYWDDDEGLWWVYGPDGKVHKSRHKSTIERLLNDWEQQQEINKDGWRLDQG